MRKELTMKPCSKDYYKDKIAKIFPLFSKFKIA